MSLHRWYAISGDHPELRLPPTTPGTRYLIDTDPGRDPELNPPRTIKERLRRALCRMPQPQAEAFSLHALSGWSYEEIGRHCEKKGVAMSQFALAWCLANPILTSVIIGPRTMEQFDDNVGCLNVTVDAADEAFINALVPPGEHSGKGFQDTQYPITGR